MNGRLTSFQKNLATPSSESKLSPIKPKNNCSNTSE
nr:MAG TPA: hypothetical protein [Caudoviricetes sp.]